MYDKNFIYKMAKKAVKDRTVGIRTCALKKKTFCISLVTGKSAVAKCHKDDLFDTIYGIGIAYCRLKGIKIKEEKILEGCIVYCDDEDKDFYVVKDDSFDLILLEADKYERDVWYVRAGQKAIKKEKTNNIDLIYHKPKMRFEASPNPAIIDLFGSQIKENRLPIEYFFNGTIRIGGNGSDYLDTINLNYTFKQNFIMLYYKFINKEQDLLVKPNHTSNFIKLQEEGNLIHTLNLVTERLTTYVKL